MSFFNAPSGLLLALTLGFLPVLSGGRSDQAKTLYVATIDKDENVANRLRLAGEPKDLVVTAVKPPRHQATRISVGAGDHIYLVELNSAKEAKLPGEQKRFGRFVVVKLPEAYALTPGHLHIGDIKNFVVEVDLTADDVMRPRLAAGDSGRAPIVARARAGENRRQIKANDLQDLLAEFSGAKEFKTPSGNYTIAERGSTKNKDLARTWLKQQYEAMGYTVSEHAYKNGKNFIAERAGDDTSKTLIISSHIDSVNNAGADDDGAGTITTLAIARTLAASKLAFNVRILGFDQEELGLIGSKAYAKYLDTNHLSDSIVGVLNVEMTGYDKNNDGSIHVMDCSENTSADLSKVVKDTITEHQFPLKVVKACTNRSDHASFWAYDIPAIIVSQNFFGGEPNPCYHLSCDRVDILNFEYMAKIANALAVSVQRMVVVE